MFGSRTRFPWFTISGDKGERERAPLSHKRSLCDFCDHSCNYYRDEVLPCIIVHVDRMGDRPVCHSIVTAASTFWWQQSHVERRGGPCSFPGRNLAVIVCPALLRTLCVPVVIARVYDGALADLITSFAHRPSAGRGPTVTKSDISVTLARISTR